MSTSILRLLPLLLSLWLSSALPTLVTEFPLKSAAVAFLSPRFGNSDNGATLTLTTFSPYGTDGVWVLRDVAGLLANSSSPPKLEVLESATQWPNQARPSANGTEVLTACGFFVNKKKATGTVDIFDVSRFPQQVTRTKVSQDKKGFFYHHAIFLDVDQDGLEDVVAARAFASTTGGTPVGELVWFRNPGAAAAGGAVGGGAGGAVADDVAGWEPHYLTAPGGAGPGVAFITTDLDGDGVVEFVAAQFFAKQQLAVFECTAATATKGGGWSRCENGTGVEVHLVDTIGHTAFFDLQWVDLDQDGSKDLLATTNTADGSGAVYAYALKGDFRQGESAWEKRTLATGYKPLHSILPGQGSPGAAVAYSVKPNSRPSVLVSGDDGGVVDVLTPQGAAWNYTKTRLITSSGTVGSISPPLAVDDSGRLVFFVPLFHEGKVQMYVTEE